mgnify:CR=1 FL=1
MINIKITILAMKSITGKPSLAPAIPIKAPTEESASERWCHASASSALESILAALIFVYQNMTSLLTMEMTAAISAEIPGACK